MENRSRIQITLPSDVTCIINKLQEAGYEAYAVGGCVRDSVLGRIPKDWDITTSAKPEEVKKLFRRTIDTGIQHGTVTVMFGKEGYEVTTYRIDGSYEDSRHPKEVSFTNDLREDLRRRDFTINAMAYNDEAGIIDVFDGISCIDEKLIKAVGNAKERLTEDALRIMRAIRFSAELDYEIDEETKSAIEELSCNLVNISAERIYTELNKLFISDHPEKIRDAYKLGVTKVIMPEFDKMINTEQNTKHHCYNVGEHTIHALMYSVENYKELSMEDLRVLRWALFLHDVGKPDSKIIDAETGGDHFYGHPEKGEIIAKNIMRRLKFDNDTISKVCNLVKYHDYRPNLTISSVRKAIVKIGIENMPLLFLVKRADLYAQSTYNREEKLKEAADFEALYKEILANKDCLSIKDLEINGSDLMNLGIEKGPHIGEILKALFEHVLDYPEDNKKEILLEKAGKLI